METIFTHIEEAIKTANIPGIKYVKSYPADYIELEESLTEDEENDTMTPMLQVLDVIKCTLENFADKDDDVRVCFCHLPGEEDWAISIGDGR